MQFLNQIILDPSLDWDKSFVSPSSKKITRATLTDRATFWKDTDRTDKGYPSLVNIAKLTVSDEMKKSKRSIPSASTIAQTVSRGNDIESTCGICSDPIDIWSESQHMPDCVYFILQNAHVLIGVSCRIR